MPFIFPAETQRQLDAFQGDDPGQLDQEVAIARLLLQQAIIAGRSGEAVALLRTLSSLSAVQVNNSVRAGKLLAVGTVTTIARRMCEAIALRLEHVPNYIAIVDALTGDFNSIFREERAKLAVTGDPKRLTSG